MGGIFLLGGLWVGVCGCIFEKGVGVMLVEVELGRVLGR